MIPINHGDGAFFTRDRYHVWNDWFRINLFPGWSRKSMTLIRSSLVILMCDWWNCFLFWANLKGSRTKTSLSQIHRWCLQRFDKVGAILVMMTLRLIEGGPREIHENIHRCIDDVSFLGFRILVVDKLVGYQQQELFTASCATIHPLFSLSLSPLHTVTTVTWNWCCSTNVTIFTWEGTLGSTWGFFYWSHPKSVWGWQNAYQKSESGAIQQQDVKF